MSVACTLRAILQSRVFPTLLYSTRILTFMSFAFAGIDHAIASTSPCGSSPLLRTVPHLANIIYRYGFKYTICYKPSVWYGSGAIGLWTQAFIFSKVEPPSASC